MGLFDSIRSGLILGIAVCGIALASCSEPPPPPPPPPPPTPAAFSLSPEVIQSAAAYEDYMARAALVNPDFKSGADVSDALRLGASDDPRALLQGEIAYAAVAALADPAYVSAVRAYSMNEQGRRDLAGLIERDPRYVLSIKGSDSAAGLAIEALMDQGRKLSAAGAAVKQAAYDIQHQPWSREIVPDRDQRLAAVEGTNASTFIAAPEVAQRLERAAAGFDPLPLTAPPATPPYPPVIVRGLAIAALGVLGEGGAENQALFAPLLSEPASASCMNLVKLNLYQCLAVSKPYYEDVFCLGEHALSEEGECVMIDAGAPIPPPTEKIPPPEPPKTTPPDATPPKHRRH